MSLIANFGWGPSPKDLRFFLIVIARLGNQNFCAAID